MSGFKIKSLSDYIKMVNNIQTKWTDENNKFIFPWFRGQPSTNHSLLPSLYRSPNLWDNEFSYRNDFKQKAYPFLADTTFVNPSTDWDWYFLMQHYGLPTRLLDWTEGSLIALYFALFYKEETDDTDPCVWVLNPFEFNHKLHSETGIFVYSHEKMRPYLPSIWSGESIAEKPIALQPSFHSKRIVVQKGCFTVHGADKIPLDRMDGLSNCLIKIPIQYYNMDLIKAELMVSGITESSLFPELGGLARELKEYWKP